MEQTARYYATGHRKNATAKVWLTPGDGTIVVNGKPMSDYFGRKTLDMLVQQPFEAVGAAGKFDVIAKCEGGGIAGQAGAVRHGISKALVVASEDMRQVLRRNGFLTRDPRVKERKKYGRKRARRGFQFSKR